MLFKKGKETRMHHTKRKRSLSKHMKEQREQLYEKAFQYKKEKLWKILWDTDIFAVKLKNDEVGYVSIMGHGGEYCALALYIGDKGFRSFRALAGGISFTGSEFKDHEFILQQKCLHVALVNRDELAQEELEEVCAYAEQKGIKFKGVNAYPQFIKYEPNYHPWEIVKEEEQEALCRAIEVAILLANELRDKTPDALGIQSIGPDTLEVPMFDIKEGKLIQKGSALLPQDEEVHYEPVIATNEIALASVKRLPKNGVWEAELVRLLEPLKTSEEGAPYYPLLLFVVERESYYVMPIAMVGDDDNEFSELLEKFLECCRDQKICPKEISVRDERTFALLSDFCKKAQVKISISEDDMLALDDVQAAFIDEFIGGVTSGGADEYDAACEVMCGKNDELLDLFEKSMSHLKPGTIDKHIDNVDFYINDYLCDYQGLSIEDGIWYLDSFLGDFFIRKCMWSTPGNIKSTATSIKKFYKCMLDNSIIQRSDYEYLCEEIKEKMPVWQARCEEYDNMY